MITVTTPSAMNTITPVAIDGVANSATLETTIPNEGFSSALNMQLEAVVTSTPIVNTSSAAAQNVTNAVISSEIITTVNSTPAPEVVMTSALLANITSESQVIENVSLTSIAAQELTVEDDAVLSAVTDTLKFITSGSKLGDTLAAGQSVKFSTANLTAPLTQQTVQSAVQQAVTKTQVSTPANVLAQQAIPVQVAQQVDNSAIEQVVSDQNAVETTASQAQIQLAVEPVLANASAQTETSEKPVIILATSTEAETSVIAQTKNDEPHVVTTEKLNAVPVIVQTKNDAKLIVTQTTDSVEQPIVTTEELTQAPVVTQTEAEQPVVTTEKLTPRPVVAQTEAEQSVVTTEKLTLPSIVVQTVDEQPVVATTEKSTPAAIIVQSKNDERPVVTTSSQIATPVAQTQDEQPIVATTEKSASAPVIAQTKNDVKPVVAQTGDDEKPVVTKSSQIATPVVAQTVDAQSVVTTEKTVITQTENDAKPVVTTEKSTPVFVTKPTNNDENTVVLTETVDENAFVTKENKPNKQPAENSQVDLPLSTQTSMQPVVQPIISEKKTTDALEEEVGQTSTKAQNSEDKNAPAPVELASQNIPPIVTAQSAPVQIKANTANFESASASITEEKPVLTSAKDLLADVLANRTNSSNDSLGNGSDKKGSDTPADSGLQTAGLLKSVTDSKQGIDTKSFANLLDTEKAEVVSSTTVSTGDKATPQVATAAVNKLVQDMKADVPALSRPLSHPDWNQDVGERIIWMNNRGISSAEIKMNPQNMGPITVRIDIDQDQATIAFTAQHAEVRTALEASIPKLREMLNSQNLNLADVNVSQQSSTSTDSGRSQQQASQMSADASANGQGNRQANQEVDANGNPVRQFNASGEEIFVDEFAVLDGLVNTYA